MSNKRTSDEIKAEMKRLEEELADATKAEKEEDLKTVKELCKKHGFTATMLKGSLKTRKKAQEKK